MTVHLINLGCKVNFADLSQIKTLLLQNNFTVTATLTDADIVLINTCAVTNQAAAQSRQTIRKAKKLNPNCFVGVLGCYAQLEAKTIINITGADAVFGTNEKFSIPLLLKELYAIRTKSIIVSPLTNPVFEPSASADTETRTRAFLKLQDGCSYTCSYCAVPAARGPSRSCDWNLIPNQIYNLIRTGYNEIVVSGVNLSDYRSDNGKKFIDLLKLLANIDKHCNINSNSELRFRISSIEPQAITNEIIDIIAGSRYLCPHFHIPLQSGSNKILQKMQRRYNAAQFENTIKSINSCMPLAFIGLDVICGFPTETESDWKDTKEFISALNISALHCFTYSPKQNTPAAEQPQLNVQVKKWRTTELIEISNKKYDLFCHKNIDRILTLLPEKFDSENNLVLGYTENYIRVALHSDVALPPTFQLVKIKSITDKAAFAIPLISE